MKVVRRIVFEEPFVFATGLAALAHSTWTLGTLFSGPEPVQFTVAWWAWLIPAFLISFSLDVGQIATSHKIRAGHRSRSYYLTFMTFAIATYYLQWLYISHHMPKLALSDGVGEWSVPVSRFVSDLAQWLIPALLPASTLLYTFARDDEKKDDSEGGESKSDPIPVSISTPKPEPGLLRSVPRKELTAGNTTAVCPKCGWTREFPTAEVSIRALRVHLQSCESTSIDADN